jgi:probable HAF family extracellular repeat protein
MTFTTLDDPLGIDTEAGGINNSGSIVGDYVDSHNVVHGFLRGYTTLNDPAGGKGILEGTVAEGINSLGQIVGFYINSHGVEHGFLLSNGVYTNFNDPLGTKGTLASGINDFGQIVGSYFDSNGLEHGFLLSNGHYKTLDDPNGTLGTAALGARPDRHCGRAFVTR